MVEYLIKLIHALNIDFIESRNSHETTDDLPSHSEEWRTLAVVKHVV
jgi:hypothetical protein